MQVKKLMSSQASNMPRIIISAFLLALVITAGVTGLNVPALLSNVLLRTGFNSVLVLAILPGILCGIRINLGLSIGIVGGLFATLVSLELNMTGWSAFLFSIALGSVLGTILGYFYSLLLNRLVGEEMTVSTYVGFSFIAFMSILWMTLPFKNPKLTWALGSGLRLTHNLQSSFGKLLNNFLAFEIGGIIFPTGLFLFLGLCCGLLSLFLRSRTGIAMTAAGLSPRFASATGVNVMRMRTIGTILSTVLGAIGIIVFSQGYGFMQLYNAPRYTGFYAASAILLGGASLKQAKISHAIIGCFLFQGILTLGMPVANKLMPGRNISEIMRILISIGVILYALTKSGGDSRE